MRNLTGRISYQKLREGRTGRLISRITPALGFYGRLYAGRL